MNIKGLLFDKDGTLLEFHTMWLEVAKGAAQDIGDMHNTKISVEDLLVAIGVHGNYVDNHGLLAANPVEDTANAWFELVKPQVSPLLFSQQVKSAFNTQVEKNPDLIQAIVGVKETLIELKQKGYYLGVATADTKDSTLYSLQQAGLLDLFDYVGYSDGDIQPKPHPALLEAFCLSTDLCAKQIVMFGDTVSDMEFGHNAGAYKIGVLTGTATADELKPHADVVLSSVSSLTLDHLVFNSIG
ncbi:HAD family hydrolase [Vibrio tapetis]|uniref:phosphoglycolate phosphatase n=1 Tax=Vibrio tapetis subsp. tapetis TaxID=1671868 RepID=A0A2N8ZCN2_9VIBR|nr:HAD family hydrolase [Vibrio tapetis]SON49655.1 Phosphoglycolate phosphatase [Vibrio tapetis subsp. tapetis]